MVDEINLEQYHAGLTKLWDALKLTGPQTEDVFTLAANRIRELEGTVDSKQLAKKVRAEKQQHYFAHCGELRKRYRRGL